MSAIYKPYSELYSPVRNDAPPPTPVSTAVTIRSKNWRGAKLVKDATKKLFL
jgi:hypothetical protein